jgi:hypothetical protein
MANDDLYVYDDDAEAFVPNPEVPQGDDVGDSELVGGEVVVLPYDQLAGYFTNQPGGTGSEVLYPPGTFYLVSQNRHISVDGTMRVDVVVEVADDMPGKQYELRVTRQ